MKANIELNRPREFGDIISDTFAFAKQNFKPLLKSYFAIGGLLLTTDIIISAWVNTTRGDAGLNTMAGLGELFFDFINHVVLTLVTLSYLAVYRQKDNCPADTIEVWGYFKYYFFRVLFTHIVLVILAAIGFFFLLFTRCLLICGFLIGYPYNGDRKRQFPLFVRQGL